MLFLFVFLIGLTAALTGSYFGVDDELQPITKIFTCNDSYQCIYDVGLISNISRVALVTKYDGPCKNTYNMIDGFNNVYFIARNIYSSKRMHCIGYNHCANELCKMVTLKHNISAIIIESLPFTDIFYNTTNEHDSQDNNPKVVVVELSTIISVIAFIVFLFVCLLSCKDIIESMKMLKKII